MMENNNNKKNKTNTNNFVSYLKDYIKGNYKQLIFLLHIR